MGQNPDDSLKIIYHSNNLIEIVKPLIPVIEKRKEPRKNYTVLEGYYIDIKQYGSLKNGQINVYDRFYQLIEHIVYRDSIIILKENFENGNIANQLRFIPNDSIYIVTSYYEDGKPENQAISSKDKEILTSWYDNGKIESICEIKGKIEKCDYWEKDGLFKNGIIRTYQGHLVISETEIDKDGKEIRKIK
jgi:antitoxin component YwqK of YwqJK toxin-antitoxin module